MTYLTIKIDYNLTKQECWDMTADYVWNEYNSKLTDPTHKIKLTNKGLMEHIKSKISLIGVPFCFEDLTPVDEDHLGYANLVRLFMKNFFHKFA